jgi:hypothetical protein
MMKMRVVCLVALLAVASCNVIADNVENLEGAPFKTAKGDGSVQCPRTRCPCLAKRVIKNWTKYGSCDKNAAPFSGHSMLSTYPFAFEKKCFRGVVYCTSSGSFYAKYYEYKTAGSGSCNCGCGGNCGGSGCGGSCNGGSCSGGNCNNNNSEERDLGCGCGGSCPVNNENQEAVNELIAKAFQNTRGDGSVRCPPCTCGCYRKGILRRYHKISESCTPGQNGFGTHKFRVTRPFAYEKRCFARWDYCMNGSVWRQDLEMKTRN